VLFRSAVSLHTVTLLYVIANTISLVAQFFEEDSVKTALWFKTRNPLLGDSSPRDMIRRGNFEKLRRFVLAAVMESTVTPASVSQPSSATATDQTLLAPHRRAISRLCRRFGVRHLAAFGSILREDFDEMAKSDVDFVVEFTRVRGLSPARQYFDFKSALERVLDRGVDLVELNAMEESRLKRIIQRTQVPVYGKAA